VRFKSINKEKSLSLRKKFAALNLNLGVRIFSLDIILQIQVAINN